jgi:hypothetical protein
MKPVGKPVEQDVEHRVQLERRLGDDPGTAPRPGHDLVEQQKRVGGAGVAAEDDQRRIADPAIARIGGQRRSVLVDTQREQSTSRVYEKPQGPTQQPVVSADERLRGQLPTEPRRQPQRQGGDGHRHLDEQVTGGQAEQPECPPLSGQPIRDDQGGDDEQRHCRDVEDECQQRQRPQDDAAQPARRQLHGSIEFR